ncbi:hypothetical protein Syun_019775 [Stephania yunnanensis]|uniref:Uncharacterized protein n=1 Tax=Stephania yunnanensis TaxID=152371 RepID=A0AAP0IUT1_9MAGN
MGHRQRQRNKREKNATMVARRFKTKEAKVSLDHFSRVKVMLGPRTSTTTTTTTEKRRRAPAECSSLGRKVGRSRSRGVRRPEHELLWGLSGEAVHGIRGLYSAEEGCKKTYQGYSRNTSSRLGINEEMKMKVQTAICNFNFFIWIFLASLCFIVYAFGVNAVFFLNLLSQTGAPLNLWRKSICKVVEQLPDDLP